MLRVLLLGERDTDEEDLDSEDVLMEEEADTLRFGAESLSLSSSLSVSLYNHHHHLGLRKLEC